MIAGVGDSDYLHAHRKPDRCMKWALKNWIKHLHAFQKSHYSMSFSTCLFENESEYVNIYTTVMWLNVSCVLCFHLANNHQVHHRDHLVKSVVKSIDSFDKQFPHTLPGLSVVVLLPPVLCKHLSQVFLFGKSLSFCCQKNAGLKKQWTFQDL